MTDLPEVTVSEVGHSGACHPIGIRRDPAVRLGLDPADLRHLHRLDPGPGAAALLHYEGLALFKVDLLEEVAGDDQGEPIEHRRLVAELQRTVDVGQNGREDALNLSLARAEAVRQAVVDFAKQQKVNLDVSQVQPVGAGILEPLVSKPRNLDEAKQNMRVEFRIVKVPAEAIKASDFDY